jgi:hypothetical protein
MSALDKLLKDLILSNMYLVQYKSLLKGHMCTPP